MANPNAVRMSIEEITGQKPPGSSDNAFTTDTPYTPDPDTDNDDLGLGDTGVDNGDSGTDAAQDAIEQSKIEQEAREAGHVSREAWIARHGNDKGWKPAAQYLERRQEILPVLQRENRELRDELAQFRQKFTALEEREAKAAREVELNRLRYELSKARDDGDRERENEALENIIRFNVANPAAPAPAANTTALKGINRADVVDFTQRNPWLQTDQRLARNFAIEVENVRRSGAADQMLDAFELAADRVRRLYPEAFKTPGSRPAMVEGGGASRPSPNGNGRTWNDLKPDVRQQYERMIRETKGLTAKGILAQLHQEPDPLLYFRR